MKKTVIALLAVLTAVLFSLGATFSDVKDGAWYSGVVDEMSDSGVINGYPDGTFRPGATISNAEFIAIAARCAGLTEVQGQTPHWAAGLLQAALNAGYYDYDECPPTGETYDSPITRQVAVKITVRAFAPDVTGSYSDWAHRINDFAALDGRYYDSTFAAYEAGICEGDNMGNFNPKSGLTRAEAAALISRAFGNAAGEGSVGEAVTPPPTQLRAGGVSENGWLQVIGTQLCSSTGEPIMLRGMSTHGIQWFPQYASADSIRATADAGANLFRVAMYTQESGYIGNPSLKKTVTDAVDAAIAEDMYVIIDWHILSDGNPLTYMEQAKQFFAEMSEKYSDSPAVIYEICNEPNGNVTWERDVKPYAQEVIAVIRTNSPEAVILVGSPTWSQDVDKAAASPLKGENIMYTVHFYAGTHRQELRDRVSAALRQGLPIFASEWGVSAASGGDGVYLDEAARWLDFLEANGISWANWSLCDKAESSAALKPGASAKDGFSQSELTESGRFVFSRFGE